MDFWTWVIIIIQLFCSIIVCSIILFNYCLFNYFVQLLFVQLFWTGLEFSFSGIILAATISARKTTRATAMPETKKLGHWCIKSNNGCMYVPSPVKLRGSDWAKWSKLWNFCFCSKSVFRCGGITSKIFRGLTALEPPPPKKKNGGQRGRGFVFFSFSIEKKVGNWKNSVTHLKSQVHRKQ